MSANRIKHKPGDRFGQLVILRRLGTLRRTRRVLCLCDCGNSKELSLQNLVSGKTSNCADRRSHPNPASKGDDVSYHGAHRRIVRQRGRANEHRCTWCDQPAEQWALGHATARVMRDRSGKNAGLPYSPDPSDYQPMCRKHHGDFDRKHRELMRDTPRDGSVSLVHYAAFLAHSGQLSGREPLLL